LTSESTDPEAEKSGRKLLEAAVIAASATDIRVRTILRYDVNLVLGISNVVKENGITDLMLGLHERKNMSDSFFGKLTLGLLSRCNCTTYIYRPVQPISTIRRHIVVIPPRAEDEPGFSFWLSKIWNIAQNTGAKIIFYSAEKTKTLLGEILVNHPINAEFNLLTDWNKITVLREAIKNDDNLIIILSRRNFVSYLPAMEMIPLHLDKYFRDVNFLLVYHSQSIAWNEEQLDITSPSLLEAIEKVDLIGKTVASIFRKK
jgi:hypothetical protein